MPGPHAADQVPGDLGDMARRPPQADGANDLGIWLMKKLLLCAGLALTVTAPAYASSGNTSTASGTAAANVVTPIVLTHGGSTLNFGSFTTGTGGTVIVTAAGSGSVSGDVGFVPGSSETADAFTVKGDTSRNFSISTTGGTVSNSGGTVSMAFSTVASAASGTLDGSGNGAFTVGGTLTVTGSETAGAYTGTYNATVAYN